ncbi:hypothetical protein Tco_0773433 [Tanacetum coccineum]|uniref:Uncharacterized protein n=1 Tax=Tanacetum coccineum TaxID=301880 RepID=A0ABQ4ZLR8_9ASTR
MATDDMVEYVLEKYEKNWNIKDEIADVILEDLQIKYGKGREKLRGNQAEYAGDNVDLVDANDVDLFASHELENRVTKLE